jgi:hypothetical protein
MTAESLKEFFQKRVTLDVLKSALISENAMDEFKAYAKQNEMTCKKENLITFVLSREKELIQRVYNYTFARKKEQRSEITLDMVLHELRVRKGNADGADIIRLTCAMEKLTKNEQVKLVLAWFGNSMNAEKKSRVEKMRKVDLIIYFYSKLTDTQYDDGVAYVRIPAPAMSYPSTSVDTQDANHRVQEEFGSRPVPLENDDLDDPEEEEMMDVDEAMEIMRPMRWDQLQGLPKKIGIQIPKGHRNKEGIRAAIRDAIARGDVSIDALRDL